MKVSLVLYGQLRHMAFSDEVVVNLEPGATVADAIGSAGAEFGDDFRAIAFNEDGKLRPSLMILLNDAPVDKAVPPALKEGDVVTVLPAIAGG